jgi:hypothetical protein
MFMPQTAVFANAQALASRLQVFHAGIVFFARFQAFGGAFVGSGHGFVACDVFFDVGLRMRLRMG